MGSTMLGVKFGSCRGKGGLFRFVVRDGYTKFSFWVCDCVGFCRSIGNQSHLETIRLA